MLTCQSCGRHRAEMVSTGTSGLTYFHCSSCHSVYCGAAGPERISLPSSIPAQFKAGAATLGQSVAA